MGCAARHASLMPPHPFLRASRLCGVTHGMLPREGGNPVSGNTSRRQDTDQVRPFAMVLGIAMLLQVTPVEAQETCSFVLGFKVLHDLIPEVVGSCLED